MWLEQGRVVAIDDVPPELCFVDFLATDGESRSVAALVTNAEQPGTYLFRGGVDDDRDSVGGTEIRSAVGLVDGKEGPAYLTENGTVGLGGQIGTERSDGPRLFELPYGIVVTVAASRFWSHAATDASQITVTAYDDTGTLLGTWTGE